MQIHIGSVTAEYKSTNEHLSISVPLFVINALPVIVFPPLYGRELMAWSSSPLRL